jgi:hypothetical protein
MPRRLPKATQEIAEVIGRERALYLVGALPRAYRGPSHGKRTRVNLYVPATLKPNHQLVKLLGWPDAMKLVAHFGGEILYPSDCDEIIRAHRDESIRRLHRDGVSAAQIAEWFGITDRQVRNIVKEIQHEANDNQCNQHARKSVSAGAA